MSRLILFLVGCVVVVHSYPLFNFVNTPKYLSTEAVIRLEQLKANGLARYQRGDNEMLDFESVKPILVKLVTRLRPDAVVMDEFLKTSGLLHLTPDEFDELQLVCESIIRVD